MTKKIVAGLLILVLAVGAFAVYRSLQVPEDLWAKTGTFPSCPSRPSCVSSTAKDDAHWIAPLNYGGDAAAAREKLERVVRSMPDADIQHSTPEYLHVLFLTPLMKFHDDVELLVQPEGVIQVRSISRFGYRDHGVNRARVEALREAFAKFSQ